MRPRLPCCDGNPRRSLCRQGACLATPSIGRELSGDAHNLECQEWRNAFAGNAIALANRLVAKQNDRAWSLRTLIAER
jgi:hypothetical protein